MSGRFTLPSSFVSKSSAVVVSRTVVVAFVVVDPSVVPITGVWLPVVEPELPDVSEALDPSGEFDVVSRAVVSPFDVSVVVSSVVSGSVVVLDVVVSTVIPRFLELPHAITDIIRTAARRNRIMFLTITAPNVRLCTLRQQRRNCRWRL